MVRIVIDHHLVAVPQPIITVVIIIGCGTEIVSPKPETVTAPALYPVNVPAAEAAIEAPVLPRMIDVIMDVFTAGIMSDPSSVPVYVRSVGVPFRIPVVAALAGVVLWVSYLGWTARRYILFIVLATLMIFAPFFTMFRKCGD